MNIFYFDPNAKNCAHQHCDKHICSQINETALILSTAHRVLDGTPILELNDVSGRYRKAHTLVNVNGVMENTLYKATHINHPSTRWARASIHNYTWLTNLWLWLLNEYSERYGKVHACEKLIDCLMNVPYSIPRDIDFTPPWRAMPDEYKIDKITDDKYCEHSYQLYFNNAKQHIAKWKHNDIPSWFIPKETST